MPEISRACAPQGETPAQWAAGAARRATPACHKERKLVRSTQDPVYQWREGKGSESRLVVFHSLQSHGYTVHGILCARIQEWGTEPRSPALQAESLPAEPQGKPKNSAVSTLSLLQRIFPIQEWTGSPALQVDSLVQKWTNIFKKLICLFIFYYYFFSFPNFFSIKVGFIAVVPGLSPGVASVCGLLILEPLLLRTGSRPASSGWCRMRAQFCDCRALQSRLSSCAQA